MRKIAYTLLLASALSIGCRSISVREIGPPPEWPEAVGADNRHIFEADGLVADPEGAPIYFFRPSRYRRILEWYLEAQAAWDAAMLAWELEATPEED